MFTLPPQLRAQKPHPAQHLTVRAKGIADAVLDAEVKIAEQAKETQVEAGGAVRLKSDKVAIDTKTDLHDSKPTSILCSILFENDRFLKQSIMHRKVAENIQKALKSSRFQG